MPAHLPQPITSVAKQLGRTPVILAVDDNPITLMVVSSFLEAAGCRVLTTQDGAEALNVAAAEHPDLMLLDIQMAGTDGLAVLRQLRADAERAALPVIVLTALAMTGDRERYLAAGADDYLAKPVNFVDLAAAITKLLTRKSGAG